MPQVVLCADGIEIMLESDHGLFLILRAPQGRELGRFPIDRSVLGAVADGIMTFQASDGKGHIVAMEGHKGGLKVRLEAQGHPAKNCRLAREEIGEAILSLNVGV